jgi:hypothetical protein
VRLKRALVYSSNMSREYFNHALRLSKDRLVDFDIFVFSDYSDRAEKMLELALCNARRTKVKANVDPEHSVTAWGFDGLLPERWTVL